MIITLECAGPGWISNTLQETVTQVSQLDNVTTVNISRPEKINRPGKNGGSWEPHSKLQIVLAETLGLGFRQPATAESMEDDTMEDAIRFKLDNSSLAMTMLI